MYTRWMVLSFPEHSKLYCMFFDWTHEQTHEQSEGIEPTIVGMGNYNHKSHFPNILLKNNSVFDTIMGVAEEGYVNKKLLNLQR